MNGVGAYSSIVVCWVLLTRVGATVFFDDFQTQWWISVQFYYLEGPPVPINVLDLRRRRRQADHPYNSTPRVEEEEERTFGGQRGSLFYDPCLIDIYMYFSVPFIVPLFTGGKKSKKVVKRDLAEGRNESGQDQMERDVAFVDVNESTTVVKKEVGYGRRFEFNNTIIGLRKHSSQVEMKRHASRPFVFNKTFHGIKNQSLQDKRKRLEVALVDAGRRDVVKNVNVPLVDGRTLSGFYNTIARLKKHNSQNEMKRMEFALVDAMNHSTENLDVALVDARRLFDFHSKNGLWKPSLQPTDEKNQVLGNAKRMDHLNKTIIGIKDQSRQADETMNTSQSPVRSNDRVPASHLLCRNDSYHNTSSAGGRSRRRKRTIFHDDHVVSYYLCTYFYINDVFYDVFYSYLDFFLPLGLSTGRSRGRSMDLIYDDVQMAVYVTVDVPFLVPILRRPLQKKKYDPEGDEDF